MPDFRSIGLKPGVKSIRPHFDATAILGAMDIVFGECDR